MKWNVEKSTNNYCDIGFKVDIGKLQLTFQTLLNRSLKAPAAPFIFQTLVPYAPSQIASVLDLKPEFHTALVVYE